MAEQRRGHALTLKQETFCQEYLGSGNATEAYRRAYATQGMKPPTINRAAKELMDNPKIAARLADLKLKVEEKVIATVVWDKVDVLRELRDNALKAKAATPVLDKDGNPTGVFTANFNASNAALGLYGKELGMFVDKKEIRTGRLEDLSDEELIAKANEAAAKLGLKLPKITLQ